MSKIQDVVIDDLNGQAVVNPFDRVVVPAAINGYGIDIEAEVTQVSVFSDRVLVSVDYVNPTSDPHGRRGGCYYSEQLRK